MKTVAEITFTAHMRLEGSWGAKKLGEHESTMTLFMEDDGTYGMIEWDIPDLEETEHIGLWFDRKVLTDYDGVMSLPKEAIDLLRAQGFTVPEEFEDAD